MHLTIRNANVITLNPQRPSASAVAVVSGHIVAVGTDSEVEAVSVPGMTTIDAEGRTLIPGFVETHTHPLMTALAQATTIDCGTPPNRTIADVQARLAQAVAQAPPGEPIRGRTYDDSLIQDDRHLSLADLDAVAPDNPLAVRHISGHLTYVNSSLLAVAGVDGDTPDPEGGRIERDGAGSPTGILFENAGRLADVAAHRASEDEMVDALGWASDQLVKTGITSVHDLGSFPFPRSLRAYRRASQPAQDKPRTFAPRVHVSVAYTGMSAHYGELDVVPRLAAAGMQTGIGDDRVRLGILKMWQDGSLQGHSGAICDPYHDLPDVTGMMLMSQETFDRVVSQATDAGIQVGTHGNGDRAIDSILDAYESALAEHPGLDHRFRIEHCQVVRDDQLDRMARLGVLASFFNLHVYYWGQRHRDRFLGPQRGLRISPLRAARDRGIVFGCHSDWWVTPVDPLMNMQVAVDRRTREGDALGPEFALTSEEALRAMTIDGAYLGFDESHTGTIEPGKAGDFALLSADPLGVPPTEIEQIEVDATIVAGAVVYDRARDGGSHRDERLARDPYRAEAFA